MLQVYCKKCDDLVQVKPFEVYLNKIKYLLGYCEECKELVYQKEVKK